jgi:hypothetical protein
MIQLNQHSRVKTLHPRYSLKAPHARKYHGNLVAFARPRAQSSREHLAIHTTMGKGEASALLKVADSAMPVVTTAQFVVLSRRVRQTVLR